LPLFFFFLPPISRQLWAQIDQNNIPRWGYNYLRAPCVTFFFFFYIIAMCVCVSHCVCVSVCCIYNKTRNETKEMQSFWTKKWETGGWGTNGVEINGRAMGRRICVTLWQFFFFFFYVLLDEKTIGEEECVWSGCFQIIEQGKNRIK
jgi:hypothetical protein